MTTPERERAELQSAVRRLRRALLAINRVIDQGSAACLRCEDDREAIRELALVALEKTAAVRK